MDARSEKLAEKTVTLTAEEVNPFNNISDWYGTEGEAVVTFWTMKHALWTQWDHDCVRWVHGEECDHGTGSEALEEKINCDNQERVIEPEKFNAGDIPEPGIYRDAIHYDNDEKVDETYSIYVPQSFLSPDLCQKWVQNLNRQYDRRFELKPTEEQLQASSPRD